MQKSKNQKLEAKFLGNKAASSIGKGKILYKFFVAEKMCYISLDPEPQKIITVPTPPSLFPNLLKY
jgi:hypothetical protein